MNTISKQTAFVNLLFLCLCDLVHNLNCFMVFWPHMTISSSFELVRELALPISLAPFLVLYGAGSFRLLIYTLLSTVDMVLSDSTY